MCPVPHGATTARGIQCHSLFRPSPSLLKGKALHVPLLSRVQTHISFGNKLLKMETAGGGGKPSERLLCSSKEKFHTNLNPRKQNPALCAAAESCNPVPAAEIYREGLVVSFFTSHCKVVSGLRDPAGELPCAKKPVSSTNRSLWSRQAGGLL